MNQKLAFLLSFFVIFLSIPFPVALAQEFNPNFVISDVELLYQQSMDPTQIQAFLLSHRGTLKHYSDYDVDGTYKSTAYIIHAASQRHQINPQYLLVLLQKEMGLITDISPKQSQYDWATGYAICDSCSPDDPALQKFRGFAKQIDYAASRTRYFYEHPDEFHFQAGQNYQIDGHSIYIQNQATAALYNYTPHIQGNKIFWKLFRVWFNKGGGYPTGTLLQENGQPGVWLIEEGKRHGFTSRAALASRYSESNIIQTENNIINQYPIGNKISFAKHALVLDPAGKVYLLGDKTKRWIVNEETFKRLGFFFDEVEPATDEQLTYFSDGEPITVETLQPFGALLQDPQTYGIYFVQDGNKHPLIGPELLSLNFPGARTRRAGVEELAAYNLAEPVKLMNGLLVKTRENPVVYIITDGQKRAIDSEFTFNALGYKWTNINMVSQGLLDLHEDAEPLHVETDLSDDEIEELTKLDI